MGRRRAVIILVSIALATGAFAYWWYSPRLPLTNPSSVQLVVLDSTFGGWTNVATATNTAPIIAVLRKGRRVKPHDCASAAHFIMTFSNGKEMRIGLGPGHQPDRYECYITKAPYSIRRSEFFSALQSSGISPEVFPRY